MNYAILIMDYYIDALQVASTEKAADMARRYLYNNREQIKREEYFQLQDIINRMDHELTKRDIMREGR